ncbi:MAG: tetratricopeptide repeat protein, partial [Bacteroidales bacterium]|nr:tetratricopeptide repeat protein [Bacteroidales bacterium]
MFRNIVICIFVLFAAVDGLTYSQELVYADRKTVTCYFEKKDSVNAFLFELIENCPSDAFIKYHSTVTVEIYRQEKKYLIKMKSCTDKVECIYRYRGFLTENFIAVDKITLRASMINNDTSIMDIYLDNKDILDNGLIMDTTLTSVPDFDNVHFVISKIEYRVTQKGLQHFREGMKRIDNFFVFDSLAANWQRQLDVLDMSNIDMLPVYQFHLKDIETEIKRYDSNEYEVLLSLSGINNQDYLQKRASLFSRVENMAMELSQKINIIDELMFKKGKQYEAEQNLQKAIFYYTRALDYNPLHCDALERLSDLYTRNNLHQENIDLFRGLRIRGEDVNCEASLTSAVCDSMCMRAALLIEQRNYYDAIKFLDTMEQLFYQIPDTTYFQTYL